MTFYKITEYKGRNAKDLRAIAYSEVVAEMMEPVLTDTDAISRISQKIKQQDKGLWGKIKDFIKGIVEKLKAAYRDMEPDSAIARLTRETVTNSEAVLDAFSEAAADAVLNYNLQEGQKNNAREGGLYSLREQTQQELTTQYQADVDSILNMQDTTQRQLLVGYTPSIYQELGMPSLPLTIGSGHVYSTAKTEAQARQDGNYKRGVHYHGLGDAAVKNIYNAIQDPVMIIAAKDVSKSASPMRSTHSVVAIVDIGTAGKSLLVPIEITAERKVNGTRMDVNTISSVYERNVSNLVKEAIALENSGDVGVYYAKKEALTLPGAGVRFPVQLQQSIASNSIVHRFSEKVNMKISENTQSQQFKRWFGDWQNDPANASKVVNADGTPKVMYHGTNAEFTVFDRSKGKKKIHLNVLGDGNYFTASEQGAARYGENVIPVYLNIKNPYVKADGFNTVADQIASEFGIARDSFTGKDVSSILRQRGYDGVVMYDGNGEIVIANAFDSTQIKSATDNIGTFDGSNPDILYSSRDSAGKTLTEAQQRYFADSQVRDEDGNLIPVYHRTDGDFTVFLRGKLGGATLSNAADAGLAATSLVGHWFSDHDLGDLIGKNVVKSYLNIQNPYKTDLISLAQEISGFSSNPEMMQAHFEDGQYNMVRKAAAEFTAWLRSEGYDGLKVTDQENGGVSYVVLDSRQAKLTTNQNPTGARDLRYSSRTASDSEYLNLAQNPEENREALSRMVEQAAREAGYTRLFFHGSKKGGGFTVFRDWQYFTENREYAKRYANRENPGSLYETYVKMENPFDTRIPEVRELFEQARQEYGMGELQENGLPDWTDGYDIADYIDENDLPYDGIILDEGGDMVNGKPVSRGLSYVIRNSSQVKSADAVTYDDNGNVIPLSQRFDMGKEDIRYSARYTAAEENPEIADLVQRVLSGDFKANDKVYLGTVSSQNAARIQEITGIDVDGFRVAIEARQIEHILNRHGIEGSADHSMAQVSDISKIGYILANPDNIAPAGKTQAYTYMRNGKNRTADTVIYEKGIGEKTYYAVQAVPDTKAKTLYIVTAFIQKNSKGASQLIGANGSNVNVRDGSVVTPTGNVAQTGTNVKGENLESRRVSQEVRDAIEEYRRQQDVQSKAYRQMYERQLEEVKKSYQKQISTMETEYSSDLAQIQDAFFQTVEASGIHQR